MYYLGLDGGGTKTEAVLCDASGHIIKHNIAGGSNPNDLGIEKSSKLICNLVKKTLGKVSASDVSAVFGIAGCYNNKTNSELFEQIIKEYSFGSFKLCPDVYNIFFGELASIDLCMLICGTGSVAFSRADGVYNRTGGWGYLIDDAGSGYDIGRKALNAVYRELDGRGEHTVLTELVSERLGSSPEDSIPDIYTKGKKAVASFTPLVFDGFYKNDKICEKILLEAAHELSLLVTASTEKINNDSIKVILCGGVFKGNKIFVEMLKKELSDKYMLSLSETPQIFGSYAEALRQTGTMPNADIKEMFLHDYEAIK